MDAAKAIGKTSDLYVAKQGLIIHISGDSEDIFCILATVHLLTENVKIRI